MRAWAEEAAAAENANAEDARKERAAVVAWLGADEPAVAKGCHECAHRIGQSIACSLAPDRFDNAGVGAWQGEHLLPDLLTPKPGAPECPGRVPR